MVQRCDLRAARDFVVAHHRHSCAPRGHKFSLVLLDDDGLMRGCAIVGRPVARRLDNGTTFEILRVCTDGIRNGCSMLYGACCREAFRRLGALKIITYTRADESGSSLRAAGFTQEATVKVGSWNVKSRPRIDKDERVERIRWCRVAAKELP